MSSEKKKLKKASTTSNNYQEHEDKQRSHITQRQNLTLLVVQWY